MKTHHAARLALIACLVLNGPSFAADKILHGTITAQDGKALEGVTVSAKLEGSTKTVSVYTDQSGEFYFPAMQEGSYKVWAQALGFNRTDASLDTAKNTTQDLKLTTIADAEARFRQLPSEMMVAALPGESVHDARMKSVFMNNCAGCHSPSYLLQFKFDEAGWNKIINLMKTVPVTGVYPGSQDKANQMLEHHQKEFAQYLANARGPGASTMKVTERPRPSGESARAVWTLYDLPINPDSGIGTKYNPNDGTNWALGTTSKIGELPHDGALGLDGTIYFTSITANRDVSIGKVDRKTGAVSFIKTEAKNGMAAGSHGLARDAAGDLWFDINPGRRALGKLDTKTDKITVYQTPETMAPVGGAVTVDVDNKGMVWASTPQGVVRFDPKTEKFTEFKSTIPDPNPRGSGQTYGVAGDRDGNGWWAQMAMDTVYHADALSGVVTPIKIPDVQTPPIPDADRKFYESMSDLGFNAPMPWSAGPRRMGTDKNGDVLWVGNSWGASLARIDTKTKQVEIVPFPDKTMQGYHATIDDQHNVWANLWTSDRLTKYNPQEKSWTIFDLPVRGTEIRHIAHLDTPKGPEIVMPVYRTSQMGVLTVRSEKEMAETKSSAQ